MGLDNLQAQQKGSGGNLNVAWTEYISRSGWAGDGSFRAGETRLVRHLIVFYSDLQTVIRELLGYSVRIGGAAGNLHRELPMRDPQFPWCYASAITSIRGIKFIGKNNGSGEGPFADYQFAIVSVLFSTPPFSVKKDGGFEWRRFVEKRFEVSSEMLNVEQGNIIWGATSPIATQFVAKNTSLHQMKTNLSWTWHQVPDLGLFDGEGFDEGGRPANILFCLGKMNSIEFEGWPPRSLLFFPPRFEPYTMPVPPHVLKLMPDAVPRAWNCTMNLVGFEPTSVGGGETTTGGWSMAPHATGVYYTVTRTGGDPLYGEVDYARAFLMN